MFPKPPRSPSSTFHLHWCVCQSRAVSPFLDWRPVYRWKPFGSSGTKETLEDRYMLSRETAGAPWMISFLQSPIQNRSVIPEWWHLLHSIFTGPALIHPLLYICHSFCRSWSYKRSSLYNLCNWCRRDETTSSSRPVMQHLQGLFPAGWPCSIFSGTSIDANRLHVSTFCGYMLDEHAERRNPFTSFLYTETESRCFARERFKGPSTPIWSS